jgi:hypothetical protein
VKHLAVILLFLSFAASAQPPKGQAKPGDVYGSQTDAGNALPASSLLKVFTTPDTLNFKITARVEEVCTKKGCWMTFKVNDTTEAFVKMKDYGFFVPVSLAGKNVVIEGRSFLKTTSVSELKHYAEDAKKPQKEIDNITAPKREVRVIANGILVTG